MSLGKILITGGAGFIGSNLAEYLLETGWEVSIIDNFNNYYDTAFKHRNINELLLTKEKLDLDSGFLKIYEGDIRDKEFIENIFNEDQFDIVIHLAAMAGVRPSIQMPQYYNDVNINGTINLLEGSRLSGVNKFIFASSSSVYGNNEKTPFSEADNVDFPISPYAATKKSGELLCHTYYHLHNISIACLRFFTVYGPRQRPDLAIHKFTNLIFNNEAIPFYGDGSTERDYTYIDDIIDGISKTITWIGKDEKQFDIFNLGESQTISLSQMVQVLETAIGKKAKLNMLPMQQGDVNRTFADISKSRALLGYSPKTCFEEGVAKFIDWYKKVNLVV